MNLVQEHYHKCKINAVLENKNYRMYYDRDILTGCTEQYNMVFDKIQNIEQIDRGYQYIDERLKKLGADIKRV